MKTKLEPNTREIESEADDFAEEVRYAVEHHGKELHPRPQEPAPAKKTRKPEPPWQVA